MKRNWHEQERITEQLKFFNHKPKRFVSCYASKPRISMKEVVKLVCNENNFDYIRQRGENALYQNLFNNQHLALAQQASLANMRAATSSGQFGFAGLGSLGGLARGTYR